MEWTALVPLGVAVIAGAWGYLRLARKTTGRIDTSEAGQLWEEGRAMRQSLETRVVAAEKRAADCEERERERWKSEWQRGGNIDRS